MGEAVGTAELRESFREVLDDIVAAGCVRRHVDEGASRCAPLWTKAAELGWFALLTPESHGGLGLPRAAAAALYEELGRAAAPLPIAAALAATEIVSAFGSQAQQAQWLSRLAGGDAAAFSASGPALDDASLRLANAALFGETGDLLDGVEAALLLAPVRDGENLRWALIDAADLSMQRIALVDRTRSLARARLDGAPASVFSADAHAIARKLRIHMSIALACDSIGGAREVLAFTIAYLKTREQFGKPIGSFQALKHRCAEHLVAIEAASALLGEAVSRWERDDIEAELYALLIKAQACDVYAAVAEDAVQLHGGIGFTWEHMCHVYLKRAKLNQVLFGASAAYHDAAARLLAA
ncbi:MAG: acyl-CoA/acyl-ACP dehydrogenase [Hydrogenophilaceae bacterium]|jgi:alkylation response protein AidB-like acyl-CoA dehydrogenase|nr:acyl-CoA/acyl-ACP dehydrogenase [Hydrogenophilaceae bacterium]